MGFVWLFWLAIIGVLAYLAFRTLRGTGEGFGHRDTPLEILDRRFAKGEISRDEYESDREVLRDR